MAGMDWIYDVHGSSARQPHGTTFGPKGAFPDAGGRLVLNVTELKEAASRPSGTGRQGNGNLLSVLRT
jgi:hypothetical protein